MLGTPADSAPPDLVAPAPATDAGAEVAAPAACPAATAAPDDAWYRTAVFYEIFVRSFRDSDGDGVGDLRGLIAQLDYLNDGDPATDDDLGVTALWLMPITASPSYHGYDTVDYRAVSPDYGDLATLDELLTEAHRRGIRVVIDLVLNHSSSEHPWFLDSARGADAPHRDWYVWSDEALDWPRPWEEAQTWHARGASWYYAVFWGGMPDLNYTTAAVQDEALAISRFWLARGIDGFRLDAVRYLVETGKGDGQARDPRLLETLPPRAGRRPSRGAPRGRGVDRPGAGGRVFW